MTFNAHQPLPKLTDKQKKMHGEVVSEAEVAAGLGFASVEELKAWDKFEKENPENYNVVEISELFRKLNDWDGSIEDSPTEQEGIDRDLTMLPAKPYFMPEVIRAVQYIRTHKPRIARIAHNAKREVIKVCLASIKTPYQPRPAGHAYARPDLWVIPLVFLENVKNHSGHLVGLKFEDQELELLLHPIQNLIVEGKVITPWDQTPSLELSYEMGTGIGQYPIHPNMMQGLLVKQQPLSLRLW